MFCRRYDPAEDAWVELPPMKKPRVLAGSVVYKEKIYVIGGYTVEVDGRC